MRRFWVGVVLLAALALGGSALAVVGGSPDSGHPYAAAVFSDHELCSGVFLDATTLVTAAHCFDDGSTVQVTFGAVTHPGAVFATSDPTYTGTVHDDPDFCLACANGTAGADTGDIAVVKIDGSGYAGPYASLPSLGLADGAKAVDVVGYGVSVIDHKTVIAFGTKRVVTTAVASAGSLGGEFVKVKNGPCSGDSGGPNLVSGTDTVLAITTFSNANPNCNGVSYSERLDTQAAQAFIASWS